MREIAYEKDDYKNQFEEETCLQSTNWWSFEW